MFHNILYYPLTLPLSSDILTIIDNGKIIKDVKLEEVKHSDNL